MTGGCRLMPGQPNGRVAAILGWTATLVTFAAAIGLAVTWVAGG